MTLRMRCIWKNNDVKKGGMGRRRRFPVRFQSLEQENYDSKTGKTELAVAGTGTYGCGMVFSGTNSPLEHAGKGFQIGCRIVDHERRTMAAGVPVVEGAGTASVIGIVQNTHSLRFELLLDQPFLVPNGKVIHGERKILDGEQRPIAILHRDAGRIQVGIEQVRPVRG